MLVRATQRKQRRPQHSRHYIAPFAIGCILTYRGATTQGKRSQRSRLRLLCASFAGASSARAGVDEGDHMAQASNGLSLATVVEVLLVKLHSKKPQIAICQVQDPDFRDELLSVLVSAEDWKVGDRGVFVSVGAKLPPGLVAGHDCEPALARRDYEVQRLYVGQEKSQGLLLPLSILEPALSEDETVAVGQDCAEILGVQPAPRVDRRLALELGFRGGQEFHGSAISDYASVEGAVSAVMLQLGLVRDEQEASLVKRNRGWHRLSRTDAGVHARSYLLTTSPLTLPSDTLRNAGECVGIVEMLNRQFPASLSVFRASWIPPDADLRSLDVSREYRYYMPRDWLGNGVAGAEKLTGLLHLFNGCHSFVNFTNIGKHTEIKRRMTRSRKLFEWVKGVCSHRKCRAAALSWQESTASSVGQCGRYATWQGLELMPETPHEIMRLTEREILEIDVFDADIATFGSRDFLCIRIVGRGFLYHMIRLMVGAAAAVVQGRLEETLFREALEGRRAMDMSDLLAPPHGLVLYAQHVASGHAWLPVTRGGERAEDFFRKRIVPAVSASWTCEEAEEE